MAKDFDESLNNKFTSEGRAKRQHSGFSLGDEPTLDNELSVQDTLIDDSEVVDLEARYKIERTLGEGGMGEVLLATDTRLGRKVAIKRILGEAAGTRFTPRRFLTEAKALAALNHPNVVQIHDYGRAKDGPFLIMEYVDGGSLLDRCRDGALPLEEAIDLACQLCDGLARAHDLGIIHRDIKPANVLLTRDGIAKLTDFGLAKALDADHGRTVTEEGAVFGTKDFMSPEQTRDASLVDSRSDLWSVAATLYQMLTGKSPRIIRFQDVPAPIQEVLGKALEDAKESRYQSAREFRDALKTGMRSSSLTVAVREPVAGRCHVCTVQNEPGRKFCRGCGESLIGPCLQCRLPLPLWDEICGECGAKQSPLVETHRQSLAAQQAQAEGLLGDFQFDRAAALATELRNEDHPRLRQLSGWVETFLQQVEKSRTEQTRQAVEAIVEAGKHEGAHDYLSAAFALEAIPESLRSSLIPGMGESAGTMLSRLKKTQAEVRRLEAVVKQRLAAKSLDDLLPDVEKLLLLQPEREALKRLRSQLHERHQKLTQARDEAIALAEARLAAHDYEGALQALSTIPPTMQTTGILYSRKKAESRLHEVRTLAARINESLAAEQLDDLLGAVERYLELQPANVEMEKLRQSLVEREETFVAEIATSLAQAKTLEQACRFEEARQLLGLIPANRRVDGVSESLDRLTRLARLRQAAMESLTKAGTGTYRTAIETSRMYGAAIADSWTADAEFAALQAKAMAAIAQEERSRRLAKRVGIAVAALAAMIAVTAVGLRLRSSARTTALATALRTGNWNVALAIDPGNVMALVGRARAKLAAIPPNIDGAFSDLDRAGRSGSEAALVNWAQADAHAARACENARQSRLDDAARNLADAKQQNASAEWLTKAEIAILNAWIERAQEASNSGDLKRFEIAIAGAQAAGASDQAISSLQPHGLMLEALKLSAENQVENATKKALEASLVDVTVVKATLAKPANQTLRKSFVESSRDSLEAAILSGDWDSALRIAATAASLDPESADWTQKSLGKHPGGLSAVPAKVLGRLPTSILASLPPAMTVALPHETIAALPAAVISALPPVRNSIGMQLKRIPSGDFTMGDGDGGAEGRHVTLTRDFYLGMHEVTNDQWKRVMGRWQSGSTWKDGDMPVVHCNWKEAVTFCRHLSELPDERAEGRVYRLPTEAEWEYACRAGTTTKFSCGDDESQLFEFAVFDHTSEQMPSRVGLKQSNPWGLYDMHGNVQEWCNDWFVYYGRSPATDPKGPPGGTDRVCRGGSWRFPASRCSSAGRRCYAPLYDWSDVGFRVVMIPTETMHPTP